MADNDEQNERLLELQEAAAKFFLNPPAWWKRNRRIAKRAREQGALVDLRPFVETMPRTRAKELATTLGSLKCQRALKSSHRGRNEKQPF